MLATPCLWSMKWHYQATGREALLMTTCLQRVALLIVQWSQRSKACQGMFLNVFALTAKKTAAAYPCFLFPLYLFFFFFGSCAEQNKSTAAFLDFVFVHTPPLLLMEQWHGELQIQFFFETSSNSALKYFLQKHLLLPFLSFGLMSELLKNMGAFMTQFCTDVVAFCKFCSYSRCPILSQNCVKHSVRLSLRWPFSACFVSLVKDFYCTVTEKTVSFCNNSISGKLARVKVYLYSSSEK